MFVINTVIYKQVSKSRINLLECDLSTLPKLSEVIFYLLYHLNNSNKYIHHLTLFQLINVDKYFQITKKSCQYYLLLEVLLLTLRFIHFSRSLFIIVYSSKSFIIISLIFFYNQFLGHIPPLKSTQMICSCQSRIFLSNNSQTLDLVVQYQVESRPLTFKIQIRNSL